MGYDDRHDHDVYDVHGAAQEHHQHSDLDGRIDGLRADLNGLYEQVQYLADKINEMEGT